MTRAALQRRLAQTEVKIVSAQRWIAGQRELVAELERNGRPAEHARYLLAGLELLEAAHRDCRRDLRQALGDVN